MNAVNAQPLSRPRLANGLPALPVIALTALAMAMLTATLHAGPAFQEAARFFCIVPVALAAYRKKGLPPGLILAAFFSAALLLQALLVSLGQNRTDITLEAVTLSVGLGLVAYAVAVIADSFWKQSVLAGAVTGSQGLLARSADLGEAANYIVRLAASAANAESAALLLKHPVDRTWRVYGRSAVQLEPPIAGESLSLAWWLVEKKVAQRLNRMDDDPRFIMAADAPVGSLLAYPLNEQGGELAAMLVLINKRKGGFTGEDAAALELRAAGVGQALEQAGLFARTDAALTRRTHQLAALQTAARDLNADLDFRTIGQRAATHALRITSADGGIVALGDEGKVTARTVRGRQMHIARHEVQALLDWSAALTRAELLDPANSDTLPALQNATSALIAPIRRGEKQLGVIALIANGEKAFDMLDLSAASALADHAAVAIANAQLFDHLRGERQTMDQIIQTLTEGLLTTDTAGIVRGINPAAEALTGHAAAFAVGRSYEEVLGIADEKMCPVYRTLDSGKTVREARWEITQPDGIRRILSLSAAPLPGAGGMVVALRDITEQEAAEGAQRELSAAFSHGLRTPLSSITLASDMLLSDDNLPLAPPQRTHLEIIRAQARRLADSTQRTLEVQQLDLGTLQLESRPLPICREAEIAAARARSVGARAVQTIIPAAHLWAWADESALHTVLDNLLDNALRYSPPTDPVDVEVAPGPAGYITISVLDRGSGIVEERRGQVFQRFYGPGSESAYGHGLGLYLSRRLVERMGGRIWLESRDGGGSRFSFTLPAYNEAV